MRPKRKRIIHLGILDWHVVGNQELCLIRTACNQTVRRGSRHCVITDMYHINCMKCIDTILSHRLNFDGQRRWTFGGTAATDPTSDSVGTGDAGRPE